MKSGGSAGGAYGTIRRYYHETRADYRFLWLNRENLALHFGYHESGMSRHADALLNTNRTLAERAAVSAGMRVLDAGCGVGGTTLWLAQERCARGVGINLVHRQLAEAVRIAARRCPDPLPEFVQADFTCTPFAAASFDAVLAVESLCHAADKEAFYREAARVLSPGGRLVVAEYMRAARPLSGKGESLLREWADGWAIPDLDTPQEHGAHAERAGLVEIDVEDFTRRVEPSLRRLYRIAWLTYPLAFTARRLRLRSSTQHGNVIAALRQYEALRQRFWTYGVLSATKPG